METDSFLNRIQSSERLLKTLHEQTEKIQLQTNDTKHNRLESIEKLKDTQNLMRKCRESLSLDVPLKMAQLELDHLTKSETDVSSEIKNYELKISGSKLKAEKFMDSLCDSVDEHILLYGLEGTFLDNKMREIHSTTLDIIEKQKFLEDDIDKMEKDAEKLRMEANKTKDIELKCEELQNILKNPPMNLSLVNESNKKLRDLQEQEHNEEHLTEIRVEIQEVEEDTVCLKSAAEAMEDEIKKLEQIVWFQQMIVKRQITPTTVGIKNVDSMTNNINSYIQLETNTSDESFSGLMSAELNQSTHEQSRWESRRTRMLALKRRNETENRKQKELDNRPTKRDLPTLSKQEPCQNGRTKKNCVRGKWGQSVSSLYRGTNLNFNGPSNTRKRYKESGDTNECSDEDTCGFQTAFDVYNSLPNNQKSCIRDINKKSHQTSNSVRFNTVPDCSFQQFNENTIIDQDIDDFAISN